MFHISQRVVCIHDVGRPSTNEFPNVPIKGGIYTVRGFVSPDVAYERTPGMLLTLAGWSIKRAFIRNPATSGVLSCLVPA